MERAQAPSTRTPGEPPATTAVQVAARRRALVGATLVLAACLAPPMSEAQIVRGRVVEEGSGTPLSGAMVVLTDSAGTQARRILSDGVGGFVLRAPQAGTYTLSADRIGYASAVSPPLELAPRAAVVFDLVAPVQAIALASITVEGERRCVLRPEGGLDVARVWEEARKALSAAAFTDETSVYRYHIMKYQRDLDADTRTVRDEQHSYSDLMQRRTFVSRPAEELMRDGFVQKSASGTFFYAPDAEVLLSDAFLDNHCLEVRRGEDDAEGLIGLAFEPVERRRDHIGIRGVMWLEPESSELRWLEFRYQNLEAELRSPHLGGRVVFAALPDGTWVVREWSIFMPIPGVRPNPFTNIPQGFLAGIRETGAVVMRILTPQGETLVESERGVIEGTVLDSLHTGPLEGVRVYADGTGHSALTGSDGHYRLSGLSEGIYRIAFQHPAREEVGYVPDPVEVEVRRGEVSSLRLLTPSRREVLRAACAREDPVEGTGILAGRVLKAGSTLPLEGATVTASWTGWNVASSGPGSGAARGGGDPAAGLVAVQERRMRYEALTGADGRFLFCRMPAQLEVVVQATTAEGVGAEPRTVVIEEAGQSEFLTVYVEAADL